MTDTITKQKEALIACIHEAKKQEQHRLKKLEKARTLPQKESLLARFDRERLADQEKIQQLTNDFHVIKEKISTPEYNNTIEARKLGGRPSSAAEANRPNRFAGVETHNQIVRDCFRYFIEI